MQKRLALRSSSQCWLRGLLGPLGGQRLSISIHHGLQDNDQPRGIDQGPKMQNILYSHMLGQVDAIPGPCSLATGVGTSSAVRPIRSRSITVE